MHALTGIASDRPYGVEVTAIPAKVQFRAESKTAWPRIYGYENGTICGPVESEYAQIDEDGRYNVKFKFDESDLKNGKASTWVRMLQPHGGGIEGWHFPLRKGTEVVFTFLGGDPDRPVIAGVVPNAHTPSPVVRANHTTNVIQTGGRNRLELEDKAGHQRITLQTPYANTRLRMGAPNSHYNLILATDGASVLDVGLVYDVNIGGAKTEVVLGAKTEITVGAKTEVVIGADTDVVVGAKVEVQVGPKIEVHCETTMEDMAEVHCETSDVHVTDTNLTLETEMTKIEERLLKLEETSTEIKSSDLTLHDSGLHMYS
jgi:type VI secretion system secreted protein VgrG